MKVSLLAKNYRIIDLNKEISTNEKFSSTEQNKDKKKKQYFIIGLLKV